MDDRVTIIIATFGDEHWRDVARRRALPSAVAQRPEAIHMIHGPTLAEARNAGALRAAPRSWLCFLDADDELEPGYVEALRSATGDLRAPSIRYVDDSYELTALPISLADRDIDTMNPCVVGTFVRREMFLDAGGFWQERAWEDWSLFRRCWLLGAEIVHVPDAVYRVNVNLSGRNSTIDRPKALHRDIVRSHAGWLESRTLAR